MSDDPESHGPTVFGPLASEPRAAILIELYRRSEDPGPETPTTGYSELREAVGIRDSGQFSYHLDRLTGRFVRKTPDGYRIRQAGRTAARLLLREAGDASDERVWDLADGACFRCGGDLVVRYRDRLLTTCCTRCMGQFSADRVPEGTLTGLPVPPATVEGRDLDDLHEAAHERLLRRAELLLDDVCFECGGTVERELAICEDHDPGGVADGDPGVCDRCGRGMAAYGAVQCRRCGVRRLVNPLMPHFRADPVDAALRAADADGPWDRIATAARWDRRVERVDGADALAVDLPTGETVTVLPDLSLRVHDEG